MTNDSLITLQIINDGLNKSMAQDQQYLSNAVEMGFDWQHAINCELERRIAQSLLKHMSDDDLIFLSSEDNTGEQINKLIEHYLRKKQ